MNIFLDSSVAIAASLSITGASREVFNHAARNGWRLLISPWVLSEVSANLVNKPPEAAHTWESLRTKTTLENDEITFDWPIVFEASKDKPVLFSALACADILLTLDRRDFRDLLGQTIYGMRVLSPGDFLRIERECRRIR